MHQIFDNKSKKTRRCKRKAKRGSNFCFQHAAKKVAAKKVKKKIIVTASSASNLFDKLQSKNLKPFTRQHAFINGSVKKSKQTITMTLNGHAHAPVFQNMSWTAIKCRSLNSFIKATPCSVGSRKKVFFRHARDLKHYLTQINGKITRKHHIELFKACFKTLGTSFINHNRDIAFLHFKA